MICEFEIQEEIEMKLKRFDRLERLIVDAGWDLKVDILREMRELWHDIENKRALLGIKKAE